MPAHNSTTEGKADERELELELRRVCSQAEAARLDARAAELELLLRKSSRQEASLSLADAFEPLAANDWQELLAAAAEPPEPPVETLDPLPAPPQRRIRRRRTLEPAAQQRSREGPSVAQRVERKRTATKPATRQSTAAKPAATKSTAAKPAATKSTAAKPAAARQTAAKPTATAKASTANRAAPTKSTAANRAARNQSSSTSKPPRGVRRRRPAAWIVSSVVHAAALLLLAGVTISVAEPVDQITLDAAPPQSSDQAIETVAFEQSAQPEEPSPLSPVTMAELSPIGTILGSEIEVETPEIRAPSPSTIATLHPGLAAESLASTEASSKAATEFFGAKGGGNHFVYLVDNSSSMAMVARDGFDVARREVLKSVDALTEEQRFYVIFFGEEVLRMRLQNPATPEPRSVYATPENKAALRRWAMGITMQPGRWPEKALEFAFELRPDALFLLTDGEMSQRAEPMIRQHNLVENLFEGPHPRSIIHTIGFYSRDGAEQMQTIARVNGGTYHFIPPPAKSSAAGR